MSCGNRSSYDWPKEATRTLIELYEHHPCLYLPTHVNYHNRNVTNNALREIADAFNKRKLTNLTPEDVKKKIHGIRTQFLSEVQKVKRSEVSGAEAYSVYQPKLWCFDLLLFLEQGTAVVSQGEFNLPSQSLTQSQEKNVEARSPEDLSNELCEILYEGNIEDMSHLDTSGFSRASSRATEDFEKRGEIEEMSMQETRYRSSERAGPSKKRQKKVDNKTEVSDLINKAVVTLNEISKDNEENDGHSLFGRLVAKELECLEDEEILDQTKQAIFNAIFDGKRKQRLKRNA